MLDDLFPSKGLYKLIPVPIRISPLSIFTQRMSVLFPMVRPFSVGPETALAASVTSADPESYLLSPVSDNT